MPYTSNGYYWHARYRDEEPQPRRWQVGDLVKGKTTPALLIAAISVTLENGSADRLLRFLCLEEGTIFDEYEGFSHWLTFSHNTGLEYQYEDEEQVKRDFEQGHFTPYFEIL